MRRWALWGGLAVLAILLLLPQAATFARPELWSRTGWSETDFSRAAIDFSEIVSGGPPKDGIPSIDNPKFRPVGEEDKLGGTEPVISLAIDGDARAYPLRILIWHEIVNDTVGATPVAVTYCPLCNSAMVFRRRVGGRVLEFGTTGLLRKSDLVMYDRQTQSWWQQFTGEAIVGELTGTRLEAIPARLEAFELFRKRHPGGKVLVPDDPGMRPYWRNPYVGYDSRGRPTALFRGDLPTDINPMARVVVVKTAGAPQAVSLELLRRKGEMTLGEVTLTWTAGQNSALDTERIDEGRDVGNIVARRGRGPGAREVVYDVTFAFVFNAFHPDRPIVKN